MRKIVIHEVNVHIGGPVPARAPKRKGKGRRRRQDAERRDDAGGEDGFEQPASERTASHVEAGLDDLVADAVHSLGSIVAIPTFQSLEDANDYGEGSEEDGDWDGIEDDHGIEDDLGHGVGDVDEHGGVPGGADEFAPGLAGDIAIPLDDALAYEDVPTVEELEAAFRDWKEPEFCGITSFWWRAFGSLMACASAGTVPEGEWVGKAVHYLSGTGEAFGKPCNEEEWKVMREVRTGGSNTLGHIFCADRAADEPEAFSLAALAVYGCDEADDLDALLMEASGVFNSAVIAEHASRLRGKPEVAKRFLATFREALRHDARLMQAAAAWESVRLRVEDIYTRRREFGAAVHASQGLAWTQVTPEAALVQVRAPDKGWEEDTALLDAYLTLGRANRTLSRGAFLAAGPILRGAVDPTSSAG